MTCSSRKHLGKVTVPAQAQTLVGPGDFLDGKLDWLCETVYTDANLSCPSKG